MAWLLIITLGVAVDGGDFQGHRTFFLEWQEDNAKSKQKLDLTLLEKSDSTWLVLDVEKQNFPIVNKEPERFWNYDTDRYEYFMNHGYLNIKSIPDTESGEFPANIFHAFQYAKKLEAKGLSVRKFEKEVFANANELIVCDFSNNLLAKVPSLVFRYAKKLETIFLAHNEIEVIEENAFDIESYVGDEVRTIKAIYLENNKLTYLPEKLFHFLRDLSILTLHNNLIQKIDGAEFTGNPNLKYLYLHNNALNSVQNLISYQGTLDQFKINDNPNIQDVISIAAKIVDITDTNATICLIHKKTETMNAANNNINTISTTDTDFVLKTLNLSHNLIESISNISVFHQLEVLDLSYNVLTYLDGNSLNTLTKLRELDVSNNDIKKMDLGFLPKSVCLENLNLGYNKLGKFQLKFQTDSLKTLRIDGNGLHRIDTNIKQLAKNLKYIGLADNNWECQHLTTSLLLLCVDGITALNKDSSDLSIDLGNNEKMVGKVMGIQCIKSVEENETGQEENETGQEANFTKSLDIAFV